MVLIVILEPVEQLLQDRQTIGTGMKRHIITFEGFHKRFRHAITLRALDARASHREPVALENGGNAATPVEWPAGIDLVDPVPKSHLFC